MAVVLVLAFFSGLFGAIYNYILYAGWKKKPLQRGRAVKLLSSDKNECLYEVYINGEDEPYRCLEKLSSDSASHIYLDTEDEWYVNSGTRTVSNDRILENYRHTIKNNLIIVAASAVILPIIFMFM